MVLSDVGFHRPMSPLVRTASEPKAPAMPTKAADPELEARFQEFAGTVFFGQLMKAMRQTLGKPAYFHAGQAEEIFQGQLDQALIEQLSQRDGKGFGGALYKRFQQGLSARGLAGLDSDSGTNGAASLARL
jgi:Rod binding domain-containing protein